MTKAPLYDSIGTTYALTRCTGPRIAEQVWGALGDARTVLNVGAGTGSYEPLDRDVTAVEPSAVMRAQRPTGSAGCVAATAERLPFPDHSFDAAMAFATVHHWPDPIAGVREMRRVARRVVVFTCDTTERSWRRRFWLTRDYLSLPSLSVSPPNWPARSERVPSRCSSRGTVLTASSRPTGADRRHTSTRRSVEGSRCGPPSAQTPSNEQCAVSAMTSHLAGGPSATTTFSISTRPSSAFDSSSPEPAFWAPRRGVLARWSQWPSERIAGNLRRGGYRRSECRDCRVERRCTRTRTVPSAGSGGAGRPVPPDIRPNE